MGRIAPHDGEWEHQNEPDKPRLIGRKIEVQRNQNGCAVRHLFQGVGIGTGRRRRSADIK